MKYSRSSFSKFLQDSIRMCVHVVQLLVVLQIGRKRSITVHVYTNKVNI